MDNVYNVGSYKGRCAIQIERKPSEIPRAIDSELTQLGGMVFMDGPNNNCIYTFHSPERLAQAEKFLVGCGWECKVRGV